MTIDTEETMVSQISELTKRLTGRVGVPYVRIPTAQVAYLRPLARDDHRGLLSMVALPYVRIPTMQVKVFRQFH